MTEREFASNRTLVGILHTIIVGTSVFSLAAWWLHYTVVFYVCAAICTLLTLAVTFLVAYYSPDGIHFDTVFNALLFLGIGMLVDRSVFPGLLVGGAIYGFVYMVPIAVTDLRLNYHHRKIEAITAELAQTRAALKGNLAKDECLEDRVDFMKAVYLKAKEVISELQLGLGKLSFIGEDLENLKEYYSTGKWASDREAIPEETRLMDGDLAAFFSVGGLPSLLDEADELMEAMAKLPQREEED